MRRIFVLHLRISQSWGGVEQHIISLLRNLDPTRIRAGVLAQESSELEHAARTEGLPVIIFRKVKPYDFEYIFHLAEMLREASPDILHTHGILSDFYGGIASRIAGVPFQVVTRHSAAEMNPAFSKRKRVFVRILEKIEKRLADHYIAVSRSEFFYLQNRLKIRNSRRSLIHNGVHVEDFEIREHWAPGQEDNSTPRPILIAYIGRLSAEKAPDDFVRACKSVFESVPPETVRFLIAGEGEMMSEVLGLVSNLGMRSHIEFLGFQEDVPSLLRNVHVIVITSITEGLPLVLLEAMAAGKAVVATRVGGITEVVKHGWNGMLAPPRKPAAIAGAISALVGNGSYRLQLGERARDTIKAGFSVQQMSEKTAAIYEKLCSRNVIL